MNDAIVLLTGATGFIGGAVLAELLQTRPDCRTILLVRAATPPLAAERVRQSLSRFVDLEQIAPALASCRVIAGDLTDPDSLAPSRLADAAPVLAARPQDQVLAAACEEITHVLHLAANTSFRSIRGVRHTNILGTMTLAHRLRREAGLKRFVYVGTAYSCGDAGGRIVREEDSPRYGARHVVE